MFLLNEVFPHAMAYLLSSSTENIVFCWFYDFKTPQFKPKAEIFEFLCFVLEHLFSFLVPSYKGALWWPKVMNIPYWPKFEMSKGD